MSVSGEHLARVAGKAYDTGAKQALDEFKSKGGQVETLPVSLVPEMKACVAPIEQGWVDRARQKGFADLAGALKTLRAEAGGPARKP